MEWHIQVPARIELLGPSQAGKSTILLKLVEDESVWQKPLKKVMYIAPLLSDREAYLAELQEKCRKTEKKLSVQDEIPTAEEIDSFGEGNPSLLIVDDVLSFKDPSGLKDLMVMFSHHLQISVVFCVQTPFFKNAKLDLTTISRNLTGRFVLYQINDWLQYQLVSARLFPEKKSFLLDCLTEAKSKYGLNYVYCNVHCFSTLPRRYMVYTGLFNQERARFGDSLLFFDLKR